MNDMFDDCVMVFSPTDSQEETERKWKKWLGNNKKSSIGDKAVPSLEETRRYLMQYEHKK